MTSKVNELAEVRLTSTSIVKRYVVVYQKKRNYELKFRQIKEESTDGSGSVCHVEFYVISYVLGVRFWFRLRRIVPEAGHCMHC